MKNILPRSAHAVKRRLRMTPSHRIMIYLVVAFLFTTLIVVPLVGGSFKATTHSLSAPGESAAVRVSSLSQLRASCSAANAAAATAAWRAFATDAGGRDSAVEHDYTLLDVPLCFRPASLTSVDGGSGQVLLDTASASQPAAQLLSLAADKLGLTAGTEVAALDDSFFSAAVGGVALVPSLAAVGWGTYVAAYFAYTITQLLLPFLSRWERYVRTAPATNSDGGSALPMLQAVLIDGHTAARWEHGATVDWARQSFNILSHVTAGDFSVKRRAHPLPTAPLFYMRDAATLRRRYESLSDPPMCFCGALVLRGSDTPDAEQEGGKVPTEAAAAALPLLARGATEQFHQAPLRALAAELRVRPEQLAQHGEDGRWPRWTTKYWGQYGRHAVGKSGLYRPRVLYLRDHTGSCTVANEEWLLTKMHEEWDFRVETVFPGVTPPQHLFYLARSADVIVGMEGLALLHAAWLPSLARAHGDACRSEVLELAKWVDPRFHSGPQRLLSAAKGHVHYRRVLPSGVKFGGSVIDSAAERSLLAQDGSAGRTRPWARPSWWDQEIAVDQDRVLRSFDIIQQNLQSCKP